MRSAFAAAIATWYSAKGFESQDGGGPQAGASVILAVERGTQMRFFTSSSLWGGYLNLDFVRAYTFEASIIYRGDYVEVGLAGLNCGVGISGPGDQK
jgi:hypothetical protein